MKNGACQNNVPRCAGCCRVSERETASTLSEAFLSLDFRIQCKIKLLVKMLSPPRSASPIHPPSLMKIYIWVTGEFDLERMECSKQLYLKPSRVETATINHCSLSFFFFFFPVFLHSIPNLPLLSVCCATLICAFKTIPHNEISEA